MFNKPTFVTTAFSSPLNTLRALVKYCEGVFGGGCDGLLQEAMDND
mgnify:CR=1 FL=1